MAGHFNINKLSVKRLQGLIWVGVVLVLFFTTFGEDSLTQSLIFTSLNTCFYASIIYGNINFLYPRFYEKGRKGLYALYSIIFVTIVALARGFLAVFIYNRYFAVQHETITAGLMLTFVAGAFMEFILSLVFRIALEYFKLKQKSEEVLLQKSKAELQLLKAQVQPHFLFNTLNNIYYQAYTEAPKTAVLIERLSDIMRYFVDESPKEQVLLSSEINFLENYIELERIRIRYEIQVVFEKSISQDIKLPPMLLMTFVENIFKHGIDKSSNDNYLHLRLFESGEYLIFQTQNKVYLEADKLHGFGIKNLQSRLRLLYAENFELQCKETASVYSAYLKIPLK